MSAFFVFERGLKQMEDMEWRSGIDLQDDAKICPCCGKVYVFVGKNESTKNNSIGYIRCMSCDMFTEI